eukprot:scaffold70971_cov74-Phaeocystis_antarctica.AAC.3
MFYRVRTLPVRHAVSADLEEHQRRAGLSYVCPGKCVPQHLFVAQAAPLPFRTQQAGLNVLKVIVPAEDLAECKGGTKVETVGSAAFSARVYIGRDSQQRPQRIHGPPEIVRKRRRAFHCRAGAEHCERKPLARVVRAGKASPLARVVRTGTTSD